MGSIRKAQWLKSYMLEFLEGGEVEDCFTFAVPPESEDFQFPQRLTETKTFGGSIFEDYGNDTYRIVLSGSTINEDRKLIYRGGNKSEQYLTGTEEIFALQEAIREWSVHDGSGAERKVYLYDLSKAANLNKAGALAGRNWWRVFIKDLKVKRDKSNPMAYKYTLEMAAVEDEEHSAEGSMGSIEGLADEIRAEAEELGAAMSSVEGAAEAAGEVSSAAVEAAAAWEEG